MTILINKGEPEQTERKIYKGGAVGTDGEIAAVGGKKSLIISNVLFQSDGDADAIAVALLARLKDRKTYFSMNSEFMPIPVERRDSVTVQERVTHEKDVNHVGLVRGIRLEITPNSQVLSLTLEE